MVQSWFVGRCLFILLYSCCVVLPYCLLNNLLHLHPCLTSSLPDREKFTQKLKWTMINCHATPKELIIIYKQHSGLTLSLVRLQCFHQVGTFECVQTNGQEFQSCGQQFEQCQICWGSKASGFNRQSEHNPPELGCFITNKLLNWQKKESKTTPICEIMQNNRQQYAAQEYKWLGIVRAPQSYFRQLSGRDICTQATDFPLQSWEGCVVCKRKPTCFLFVCYKNSK